MSRFVLEIDAGEPCPIEFEGKPDVLVYFLSFAFATRYGSQHELSKLALLLRSLHKIDMAPLMRFADRDIEEEADARELERAWQDAAPLAATLERVIAVLDAPTEQVSALVAEFPDLRDRLDDLRRMASWAVERGARLRLTFEL